MYISLKYQLMYCKLKIFAVCISVQFSCSVMSNSLQPQRPHKKVFNYFCCFSIYLPWSDGTGCHDLNFLHSDIWANFSPSSFTFIKRFFSSSSLSAIRVMSSAYLRLLIDISPCNLDSSYCFIQPSISLHRS